MLYEEQFLKQLPDNTKEDVEKLCKLVPEALPVFQRVYECGLENSDPKRKYPKTETKDLINEENIVFELQCISVLSPIRKKLNMTISLSQNGKPTILFNKNKTVEFAISELNTSVKYAAFLPYPENKNIVYLLISYSRPGLTTPDTVLLTMNKEAILKQFKSKGMLNNDNDGFSECIEYMRKQAILTGFRIADPFSDSQCQPAFHVECHRGSKESTLYFLQDHIIFGFKKPILIFSCNEIESITYSSITRITFNVTLTTKNGSKYEFSMVDKSEYANINGYAKRNQLQDKSMSDELKAKPMTKAQQIGEQSALKEATQQMKEYGTMNNIPLDSEDEEQDGNFEGDSILSDGSDSDSNSNEVSDDGRAEVDGENSEIDIENESARDVILMMEEENDSGVEYD